jgi:hypothetical protein
MHACVGPGAAAQGKAEVSRESQRKGLSHSAPEGLRAKTGTPWAPIKAAQSAGQRAGKPAQD